ncbi:hypothetical protein FRAAL4106 [Frankia alni ACN14a]|uniref:Uncharacterized protein n=1 Tax=Frankia alni (strain DSM 45986 / CECT 9034 / ACN14a) TaxID=326424 RepID=Q0RIC2_FRAAA|nr:hypothetical protein FRAAL4106 [Frankia alni ACN14a]
MALRGGPGREGRGSGQPRIYVNDYYGGGWRVAKSFVLNLSRSERAVTAPLPMPAREAP